MSDFIIQPAEQDDLSSIIALWRERMMIISQSVPQLRSHIPAETDHLAHLQTCLTMPNTALLCAKGQTMTIGYILATLRDDQCLIAEMALDAHAYHRGLAKALLNAVQTRFMTTAPMPIVICVPRYYAVEQAFWRALGARDWKETTWQTNPLYQWMRLSSAPQNKPM